MHARSWSLAAILLAFLILPAQPAVADFGVTEWLQV